MAQTVTQTITTVTKCAGACAPPTSNFFEAHQGLWTLLAVIVALVAPAITAITRRVRDTIEAKQALRRAWTQAMQTLDIAREVFVPDGRELTAATREAEVEAKLSILSGFDEATSLSDLYLRTKSLGPRETALFVRLISIVVMARGLVDAVKLDDVDSALSLQVSLNLFSAVTAARFQTELAAALGTQFPDRT